MTHCIETAKIVDAVFEELGVRADRGAPHHGNARALNAVVGALLHDTLDDAGVSAATIEENFGREVRGHGVHCSWCRCMLVGVHLYDRSAPDSFLSVPSIPHPPSSTSHSAPSTALPPSTHRPPPPLQVRSLVEGVSQLSQVNQMVRRRWRMQGYPERTDLEEGMLRELMVKLVNDPIVLVVKLADRLHNMRTIHVLAPHKRQVPLSLLHVVACTVLPCGPTLMRAHSTHLSWGTSTRFPATNGHSSLPPPFPAPSWRPACRRA